MQSPYNNNNPEEIPQLRSQNDQLWKIIEKQRVMIQNLQKDNVRLSTERDGLQDKISQLEQELSRKKRVTSLIISPQTMQEICESNDDASPILTTQPMPPPRSPYRPLKEKQEYVTTAEDSEEWMNGRSSPGSPAPSPIYSNSKFNATTPNFTSKPPISPSKSTSSLKARDSMPPPIRSTLEHDPTIRAASPPCLPLQNNHPYGGKLENNSRTDLQQNITTTPNTNNDNNYISNNTNDNNTSPISTNLNERDEILNNLSNLAIRVVASNIKANDKGKEVISFTLAIGSMKKDGFDERWRVEKLYSDFLTLDSKLKRNRSGKMGKLPDKTLFSNNAPSKVDQRKVAIEHYLQQVISSSSLENKTDFFEFLSTDILNGTRYQNPGLKEGYLTKRGKNFGGWKTRYFVLNDSILEYYESKEGTQLGAIRLTNAQIGRQMPGTSPASEEYNSVYRHAFLIVEQKRSGSSHYVRHILCASSDDDRDEWVQALLMNIQVDEDELPKNSKKIRDSVNRGRKLSKGEIRPIAATPISHLKLDNVVSHADMEKLTNVPTVQVADEQRPSPSISSESSDSLSHHNWHDQQQMRSSFDQPSRHLQTPRSTVVRRSSMGNLIGSEEDDAPLEPEKKARNKANRMTFWGRKMLFNNTTEHMAPRPSQSSSTTTNSSNSNGGLRGFLSRTSHEQNDRQRRYDDVQKPSNQVFGVSLDEAVRISRVKDGYELPAVVYRCIEYLDAMNAVLEEGLYRLSGSNSTMKALRERFNQEGDVDLLASKEEYDVHVVAGLLKMWLRELPTSVLTREHRMDFLHVIDLLDRKDRVNELGRLVSVLPLSNYTLLRALTAHLIRVVQHSDINKMTMRNVSIVFSPTLGIPATIFNLFLSEFEYIFWTTEDGNAAPRRFEDLTVEENKKEMKEEAVKEDQQAKRNSRLKEEQDGRNNRNSVNYMDGAPHAIVDLEKNLDGALVLDDDEDEVDDLSLDNNDISI